VTLIIFLKQKKARKEKTTMEKKGTNDIDGINIFQAMAAAQEESGGKAFDLTNLFISSPIGPKSQAEIKEFEDEFPRIGNETRPPGRKPFF
jgi:hypothetical protein